MPAPLLLSAALIVKNEEAFLASCLRSLEGVVDEIVVVDTGSSDRSRDIARAFGARLDERPWSGDFAAARNHALDRARGEWILYIDADEQLRPCDLPRLRHDLMDLARIGYYIWLRPRPEFTAYPEMRLFRNHPLIRFRGVIHESIWPGIHAYQAAHGGDVGSCDLVLDHKGYEGDQRRKHRRDLPLLRKGLRHYPGKVFSWCHLARICLARGRHRLAEAAWLRAIDVVRTRNGRGAEDSLPYLGLIRWCVERGGDTEELLTEAWSRFPDHPQLHWITARACMRAGRYDEAVPLLERLVAWGEHNDFDRAMAYDERIFGVLAWEMLATAQFQRGRYTEAGRWFARAEREDPGNLEYRVKRALCARLADREAGAAAACDRRAASHRSQA